MTGNRKIACPTPSRFGVLIVSAALAATYVNGGTTNRFDQFRKILVSPTVNTPEFMPYGVSSP